MSIEIDETDSIFRMNKGARSAKVVESVVPNTVETRTRGVCTYHDCSESKSMCQTLRAYRSTGPTATLVPSYIDTNWLVCTYCIYLKILHISNRIDLIRI